MDEFSFVLKLQRAIKQNLASLSLNVTSGGVDNFDKYKYISNSCMIEDDYTTDFDKSEIFDSYDIDEHVENQPEVNNNKDVKEKHKESEQKESEQKES